MTIKAGARLTRKDTHIVDITLVPPTSLATAVTRPSNVQQTLVQAIRTIRLAMASAAVGDDPWYVSAGRVDIEFVVTQEGTISLGAEGELSDDVSQTLRLRLAPRQLGPVPAQARPVDEAVSKAQQG